MNRLFTLFLAVLFIKDINGDWGPFKTLLYSDYITSISGTVLVGTHLDGILQGTPPNGYNIRINGNTYLDLTYLKLGDHNKTLNYGVSETQVFFYDFQNNFNISYPIDSALEGITSNYNLDVTRRLIFFVPGYKSGITKKTEELVRQTFKDVPNIYLIIIDHSMYTSARGGRLKGYERSVTHVYYIGQALGTFLAGLRADGYPSKNIHAIGHSLGSQMLGYVGTKYTELTKEKIWRVTGIDPAGPCFSNSFIQNQIRSGVGEYVEVYHCNAGGLGSTAVLADTDFFFNKKGQKQPPCHEGYIPGKGESDAATCSHKACVRYYMTTVHHPDWFLAWQCNNYDNFSDGRCSGNQVTIAGYGNPGNATGVFYVSTEAYGVF